jgi:hypothetical protein
MKKQICCVNMGNGVEGTALCGLNCDGKREEALRVPHSKRKRMEELEGSYRLHAMEMASGSLTD